MGEPTFTSLLIVVGVAFLAPLLLGLFPGVRLPPSCSRSCRAS